MPETPPSTQQRFTLPTGLAAGDGANFHREGVMRQATVRDERVARSDARVQGHPAYFSIAMLARFVVQLGSLEAGEIDEAVIKLIPSEVVQKYLVLPVNRTGATLTIAMADPTNVFAMDDIKFMTGYNVEPVVASEISLDEALEKYYGGSRGLQLHSGGGGGGGGVVEPVLEGEDDGAPVDGDAGEAPGAVLLETPEAVVLDGVETGDAVLVWSQPVASEKASRKPR